MSLAFSELCTLLTRLEDIETKDPPLLHNERAQALKLTTESWFKSHRSAINALTAAGGAALLSALLPERRTDRVYGIQSNGLCRILCRSLHLQAHRARDLRAYKQPGTGDLGACLERVLQAGGPPGLPAVSIEDVDDVFVTLAGRSIFSDPSVVQLLTGSSEQRDNSLANLVKRMEPVQAKWFARLILKDLSPVTIDEGLVLKCFHFLLPDLLRFQQNFDAALTLLEGPLKEYPERPDPRSERLLRNGAAGLIRPCVGVKVGRPTFHKARSIEHCMKMLGQHRWVLERKYDGEYCEIHVDLSWSQDPTKCIKIFSKSGKDSTHDRKGIHKTLARCLKLDQPDCKISRRAILLGELIVWSDSEKEPLPFEKIRKHVTRSGVCIGTDVDSQRKPDEHLAIVFFDLLLLDDVTVMIKPVEQRRQWLREVYTKIEGRAMSAEWRIADFAEGDKARKALLDQFAMSNARRCEGLVLKPCGMPYFALHADVEGFRHGFIKLKKDYLSEMGDEADLAVIGASYNSQQALKSGLKNIKWTDFHLGALTNKDEVERFGARPIFKIVGTIQQAMCIPKPILQVANVLGALSAKPYDLATSQAGFDLDNIASAKIDFLFSKPLVFEVLGSGFEKPSNSNHFMLRHARVKKLHQDRSWKDCVSFQELQVQANASRILASETESQERRTWLAKLERRCRKKFERERTATPKSDATKTPGTGRISASEHMRTISVTVATERENTHGKRMPLQGLESNSIHSRNTSDQTASGDIVNSDGSTSVQQAASSNPKRRRNDAGETPCPEPKRLRALSSALIRVPETPMHAKDARSHPQHIHILQTSDRAPTNSRTIGHTRRQTYQINGSLDSARALRTSSQKPSTHFCTPSACPLADTIVYLVPCISRTPYVIIDLLSKHAALSTSSLIHWDRNSHARPTSPPPTTVSESQAFPGLKKVILVESKREQAVRDVVKAVLALNGGVFQERVEVWDWRVMEESVARKIGVGGGESLAARTLSLLSKRWLVGATIWDEGKGKAAFVWR